MPTRVQYQERLKFIQRLPPHTVLGVRNHVTTEDTWWFRLRSDYWVMIGFESSHSLSSELFLRTHMEDAIWIESLPSMYELIQGFEED